MSEVVIRKFKKSDELSILNICYKTGYMGEDLTGRDLFDDIKLFGYLFCLYYPYYEPYNCFVAVDKSNSEKIVGYIIGTDDSHRQEVQYAFKMVWRILLRLVFVTLWAYPKCFRFLLSFIFRTARRSFASNFEYGPKNLYLEYPAHLHINILPEYQRYGVGSKLIEAFEMHIKDKKVQGIHLRTSNQNYKALPFYEKRGFKKLHEDDITFWKDISDYKNVVFGKKL